MIWIGTGRFRPASPPESCLRRFLAQGWGWYADVVSDSFKKFFDVVGRFTTIVWLVRLFLSLLVAERNVVPEGFLENPLPPLTYFVGVLAATGLAVKAGKWGWRKLNPLTLTIEPYGGTEACLAVRPSLDGEFYGIGQLLHSSFGPQQHFDLDWKNAHKKRHIRAGDKDLIILSMVRITDHPFNPPVLVICGNAGSAWPSSNVGGVWSISLDKNEMLPLGWIHIRTEIRSTQSSKTWVNEYRFRFSLVDFRFEIEEIKKPSASHKVLGLA